MSTAKCPPAAIQPIIFVPGIMGTRLSSSTDRNAWNPPSPFGLPEDATRASDENIPKEEWRGPPKPMTPMMTPPGVAAAYEEAWNANPANQPNEQYTREMMQRAAERDVPGWNSVADWSTSGGGARRRRLVGAPGEGFSNAFLSVNKGTVEEFRSRLPTDLVEEYLARNWGGLVWEFYGGFMRWLQFQASAAICPGASIKIEAWAHPYNWSGSNQVAAAKLAETVATAQSECAAKYAQDPLGRPVLKPVIITHSMGGLVARAYARHYGGENAVHAIIHGAMPTQGAPATYKRMRFGFEGAGSLVLGLNGRDVTALLSHMPGGLELLPTRLHLTTDGGREWFFADGMPPAPVSGDPYQEIYKNRSDWWRLIIEDWVDPENSEDRGGSHDEYRSCLSDAEEFHDGLGHYFHPNSRLLYAENHPSWDRIRMRHYEKSIEHTAAFEKRWGDILHRIDGPSAPGDGTVHRGSNAQVGPAIESVSRHIETDQPFEFTHDGTYGNSVVRSQVAFWLNEFAEEQLA